ncbi:MAG: pimeloyl-ACP methyl ester carboxylesterase [Gammaproteobacteria bacterium]|jgi:pimeloyl-ACP methyl ester carboxylesterase
MSEGMRDSQSVQVPIRGLNYHCRTWGDESSPRLFLLHGFQDVSASWQFTVDAFTRDWYVIAPDWRGYGLSDSVDAGTYWFPDLVADLDALLDHFEPENKAMLVGHSMGANAAAIYAGVVPGRIEKFINVEGIGGAPSSVDELPRRYAKWIEQSKRGDRQRPYADFEDFAERMMSENPRLTPERARFLVRHWGQEEADGTIIRRADPAHSHVKPTLWRLDEAMTCWRRITAPMLFVEGDDSRIINAMRGQIEGYEERLAAFETLVDIARIGDAGHNIHHDQPEKLAAAIEGFL